jgi:hypothetical protein
MVYMLERCFSFMNAKNTEMLWSKLEIQLETWMSEFDSSIE